MSAQFAQERPATNLLPGSRRRDATANRETLLWAAQAALAEQPTASLDAIAQAAGLTRRALYGHFPDRDALLHEVIAVGARQFREIATAASDNDPRVALAQLAARLWNAAQAVRASAHISAQDAYADATAQALEPLRQRLTVLTQQGVGSGAFRRDMTPELLAFLIEETARATLRARRVAETAGAETAVKVILSIVGLSWQEQGELLATHPEVLSADR